MSKIKRISAAAVATGALTVGALAFASPAMAGGPGYGNYDCSPYGNPVTAKFTNASGTNLSIVANISFTTPATTSITSTLDGVGPGPHTTLPAGSYPSIALAGAWTTPLSAPPKKIVLTASPTGLPPVTITCNYIGGQTGTWPV